MSGLRIERLTVDNLREGVLCRHSEDIDEMYDQLAAWLKRESLRGQVARDDGGEVAGFILYYPVEEAPLDVEGEGLYVAQCMFVKPHLRKNGIGRALVESAVDDARAQGASGFAVEGFKGRYCGRFEYMPASFFEHLGMTAGESRGAGTLYFKGLIENARPPRYLRPQTKMVRDGAKVRVDILDCGRCYEWTTSRKLMELAIKKIGGEGIEVVVHDQNSREAIVDKGMSSGVFVDGKLTFFSGPITEDDVVNAINVAAAAREKRMDR